MMQVTPEPSIAILPLIVLVFLFVVVIVIIASIARKKNAAAVILGLFGCIFAVSLVAVFFLSWITVRKVRHDRDGHVVVERYAPSPNETRLEVTYGGDATPDSQSTLTVEQTDDSGGHDALIVGEGDADSLAGQSVEASDVDHGLHDDSTTPQLPLPPTPPTPPEAVTNDSAAWQLVEGDHYLAKDTYSTRAAATRALATLAAEKLWEYWTDPEDQSEKTIYVNTRGNTEKVDTSIFVDQLVKEVSPVEVVSTITTPDESNQEIWLRVYLVSDRTSSTDSTGALEAVVRNLKGPGESPLVSTKYAEKFWLNDPKLHYELARSDLKATREAASQQAIANAADALFQKCDSKFGHDMVYAPGELRTHLIGELQQGRFIKDRFSQELVDTKTGVTVWRHALLLDPNVPQLSTVVNNVGTRVAQVRQVRMTKTASTFGFFVVILGLYAVLNAATRGYYTWVLRGTAVVLAISVVAWVVITWT